MKRLSTVAADFEAGFVALLGQARETTEDVADVVAAIIADVKARGDVALCDYTTRFDRFALASDRIVEGLHRFDVFSSQCKRDSHHHWHTKKIPRPVFIAEASR